MTRQERVAKTAQWLRVYEHEMSRRREMANEEPKEYKHVFGQNLKPLLDECKSAHCWVPATILWIHDGSGKTIISGVRRRGFFEAAIFDFEEYQVQPQICWNCSKTRERIISKLTNAQKRLAADKIHIRNRRATYKPRGKQSELKVHSSFEELDALFSKRMS